MNSSSFVGTIACAAFFLTACAKQPLAVRGFQGQTLSVAVGQELDVTLQTVGPGQYESPPMVSSPSLQFLSVAFVGPYVPAGPTQQFKFKGEAPGQAIVVFQHSGNNPTITDIVNVY
ncbi:MAG TPA: hypothetical protein VGV12_15670 [Gemmatimonadales bacterium]|nr:hypothetical protein [Gemmatimonadales bacterium]